MFFGSGSFKPALFSDLALLADPVYKLLSHAYAEDLHLLTNDFARAWYKLTTMDMGPAVRYLDP